MILTLYYKQKPQINLNVKGKTEISINSIMMTQQRFLRHPKETTK